MAKNILSRKRIGEALIRTAIGRAYYAAFLFTREKLKGLGIQIRQEEKIHQEVIEKLKKKDTFSGDLLDDLREERIKADYYLNEHVKYHNGTKSARLSELIINKVRGLR